MTHVNQDGTNKDRLLLWGIIASAALVRLAYAMLPRLIRWDEAGHLMIARNLITGHGYTVRAGSLDVHLPPVLPLASAALLKLGLTPEWATSVIHIVTGALLCLPVYALGRAIYGRRVGFIAATLVAVYPALAAQPFLWGTMTAGDRGQGAAGGGQEAGGSYRPWGGTRRSACASAWLT
ncbi:MAG: hypothetical protein CVU38_09180 [Chloroflexi bacterium HGW-Chloroflexi-1]|nr:MAG: hypothetical protein CVU38_09180 [Chloroflexi bacterium HGW-Chloroflexi-1]